MKKEKNILMGKVAEIKSHISTTTCDFMFPIGRNDLDPTVLVKRRRPPRHGQAAHGLLQKVDLNGHCDVALDSIPWCFYFTVVKKIIKIEAGEKPDKYPHSWPE